MDNLFDRLKSHLDQNPLPAFEERDWLLMEKKIENQKQRRTAAWLLVGLLPILLTSFYFNLKQYNQLQATEIQWKAIQSRLDSFTSNTSIQHVDTIYQERIIYRRDTVYLPGRSYAAYISEHTNNTTELALNEKPNINLEHDSKKNQESVSENQQSNIAQVEKNSLPEKAIEGIQKKDEIEISNKNTEIKSSELVPAEKKELKNENEKVKNIPLPVIKKSVPPFHNIGFYGGAYIPVNSPLDKGTCFTGGLKGQYGITSSFSLWASVDYLQLYISSNRMSESIGMPPISSPSVEFLFIKAMSAQPSYLFGVGGSLSFLPQKKIQPVFGIGYSIGLKRPYEITYEFENPQNNVDWLIKKEVARKGVQSGYLTLESGIQYRFRKRWYGSSVVHYRTDVFGTDGSFPSMIGFKSGIQFKF